jgi:hypothetical protein
MAMPELAVVAEGALPSGHRWIITAGGTQDDYYTMIETVHPDGYRDEGGMGGPIMYPGRALNTYGGSDNRGLHRILARARPNVARVRLVLGSGESFSLAPIVVPCAEVVVFAALLPRTCEITSVDAISAEGKIIH